MKRRRSQHRGTGRRFWNRVIILPLCAGLVIACGVTNPVWSAGASEDKQLHKLFRGQQVNATLKNSRGYFKGRVEKVLNGFMTVDVEKSSRLSSIPRGFQEIPVERVSTVRWTEGSKHRKIFFTVGLVTGIVGGLWLAGSGGSLDGANLLAVMGTTAGGGLLGYMVGWRMDQKSVKLDHQ